MLPIEQLRIIEDERRREARRADLVRSARSTRIHHRSLGERVGRWLGPIARRA